MMRGQGTFKKPFAIVSWPDPGVEAGVGSDLDYPIPFAKNCEVTLSEVPFYYSISYRAYAPGTAVETFSSEAMKSAEGFANKVADDLTWARPVSLADEKSIVVRPDHDRRLTLPRGPSAIDAFKVGFVAPPDPEELRSTVVEMRFDGETTVWCPLSEFFGCGIHGRSVWDRYRTTTPDGMACFWAMPYAKSAEIVLHNYGKKPVALRLAVSNRPWKWDARSLHFHATWRRQYPLATRPMSDWNYLEANGRGIYVGDTLTVFSPSSAWYGEGDERVYVDGESFPSHLGTGTEDYYGYAWGMAEHYSSPFISMPARDLKGRSNWMGFTTTSRMRGLDAIPFERSFRFDMEIWDWADCNLGYSAATFWYARPGAGSNRAPSPKGAAAPLPEWSAGINGAIECENLAVASKSAAMIVETQSSGLTQGQWSGGEQLFLRGAKVGDFVELRVPAARTGRYRVVLYGTKSYDYGIVRFTLDGQSGKDVDMWSEKPIASGPIDLGVVQVQKGDAILRAEVVGTNPRSTGAHYYFGLDCAVLKPA